MSFVLYVIEAENLMYMSPSFIFVLFFFLIYCLHHIMYQWCSSSLAILLLASINPPIKNERKRNGQKMDNLYRSPQKFKLNNLLLCVLYASYVSSHMTALCIIHVVSIGF